VTDDQGTFFGDPDPETDRLRRDAVLPNWLAAVLIRDEADRLRHRGERVATELRAEPYPHRHSCFIDGCPEPASEEHHVLPRAMFGALAERGGLRWVCEHHHSIITEVFELYGRAQVP
jgi:hypothetical protein